MAPTSLPRRRAVLAISAVIVVIALGFGPFVVPDVRRVIVFGYATLAVILGLVRMALTIILNGTDPQNGMKTTTLVLDVYIVAFGAPAAFLGAFAFLTAPQQ